MNITRRAFLTILTALPFMGTRTAQTSPSLLCAGEADQAAKAAYPSLMVVRSKSEWYITSPVLDGGGSLTAKYDRLIAEWRALRDRPEIKINSNGFGSYCYDYLASKGIRATLVTPGLSIPGEPLRLLS